MSPNIDLSSIPSSLWLILGVLAVIQIGLDVLALVSLARRPREQITFGTKWPWVLIIVLINFIGAILYFAIGRQPGATAERPQAEHGENHSVSADTVADALYGQRDEEPK